MHVCLCSCATVCICFQVFSRLPQVNRIPNQVFITIIVILRHLIVNHTLSRPILVESQQCNDKASCTNTA